MASDRQLRLTQIKSGIGYEQSQKDTLRTLGFRRLYQTVVVADSPTNRGLVRKVNHLLRVEEVTEHA